MSALDEALADVSLLAERPELLVADRKQVSERAALVAKRVFDQTTRGSAFVSKNCPLSSLVVKGFTAEQIWEELQLQTVPVEKAYAGRVDALLKTAEEHGLLAKGRDRESSGDGDNDVGEDEEELVEKLFSDEDSDDGDVSDDGDDNDDDDADEDEDDEVTLKPRSGKRSAVSDDDDDDDDDEMDEDDEDVDYAVEPAGSDSDDNATYKDFFDGEPPGDDDFMEMADKLDELDAPSDASEGDEDEDEDDDEEDGDDGDEHAAGAGDEARTDAGDGSDDEGADVSSQGKDRPLLFGDDDEHVAGEDADVDDRAMSSYRRQQERLRKQIAELEQKSVQQKPWQLSGEVSRKQRPKDSLLEERVEFDRSLRPPPLVTEEFTSSLEDVIRARVKDRIFDDVERKRELDSTGARTRAVTELNDAKPTQSLAEVYEQEYMERVLGAQPRDSRLSKQHAEIAELFRSLCYKLDALSNYHYTPKPVLKDLTVAKKDASAIEMEEAVPVAMSHAAQLAPAEVYASRRKPLVGVSEMASSERAATRRQRKTVHQRKQSEREASERLKEKLRPGKRPSGVQSVRKAEAELRRSSTNVEVGKESTAPRNVWQKLDAETRAAAAATGTGAGAPTSKAKRQHTAAAGSSRSAASGAPAASAAQLRL